MPVSKEIIYLIFEMVGKAIYSTVAPCYQIVTRRLVKCVNYNLNHCFIHYYKYFC